MNIIRITTDCKIDTIPFPRGSGTKALCELIGNSCELVEHVMPKRLYEVLKGSRNPSSSPGECISMLVDEVGLLKDLPENLVGCWLYKTDIHGAPIVGNVLIIGEMWQENGISFCGMSEQQFNLVYPQLKKLTEKARVFK